MPNDAARLMWDHDIGALPVVAGENRVRSVVRDRDIAMAVYLQGRLLGSIPVQHVISTSVRSARSDEPIERASSSMASTAHAVAG